MCVLDRQAMNQDMGGYMHPMGRGGGGAGRYNAATFLEKCKSRLKSRDAYQDFLKCINMYTQVRGVPTLVIATAAAVAAAAAVGDGAVPAR